MEWFLQVFGQVYQAFADGWYMRDSHAFIRQAQRGISDYDVEDAICADRPEIIQNHPNYWQGPAVLILGWVHYRPLHIFCTIESPPLFVTCYHPDPKRWYPGYKEER